MKLIRKVKRRVKIGANTSTFRAGTSLASVTKINDVFQVYTDHKIFFWTFKTVKESHVEMDLKLSDRLCRCNVAPVYPSKKILKKASKALGRIARQSRFFHQSMTRLHYQAAEIEKLKTRNTPRAVELALELAICTGYTLRELLMVGEAKLLEMKKDVGEGHFLTVESEREKGILKDNESRAVEAFGRQNKYELKMEDLPKYDDSERFNKA